MARVSPLGHGDLVLLADFREHEASRTRPFRNAAIFPRALLLGRALVGKGAACALKVVLDRDPEVLELVLASVGGSANLCISSAYQGACA